MESVGVGSAVVVVHALSTECPLAMQVSTHTVVIITSHKVPGNWVVHVVIVGFADIHTVNETLSNYCLITGRMKRDTEFSVPSSQETTRLKLYPHSHSPLGPLGTNQVSGHVLSPPGSSTPCSSGGVSMAEVPLHSERDSSRAGNIELSNIL